MSRAQDDQPDYLDETARIAGYLAGEPGIHAEVDGWIRIEMRHRYPGLADEHEDLCQVVHEKLLINLRAGRFEGRSALRTYVTGIAHHTGIDRARQIRRQSEALILLAREPERGGGGPEALPDFGDTRLMHRAILATPADCRKLWGMVFLDKLAYEEIARRMSIPAGTVKSRMWHCRKKAMAALKRLETGKQKS